jgi:hypothetical protein
MENPSQIEAIEASFNNYTQVNQTLVKHFGDANPGFIFGYISSQAKYYRELNQLDDQGYFWCKADKIQEKFGMSRKVQDNIIKKLESINLISVINKTVQGSFNPAQIRHFKINYTVVYNFINGIKEVVEPTKVETLPFDLLEIKNALKDLITSKGAKFYSTTDEEEVLKVARSTGFTKEIHIPLLAVRIKKWNRCTYNCKYLVTSLMANFQEVQSNQTTLKPKQKYTPLLVA